MLHGGSHEQSKRGQEGYDRSKQILPLAETAKIGLAKKTAESHAQLEKLAGSEVGDSPVPLVRYNLACTLAEFENAGDYERCLHHLRYAMVDPELRRWAPHDPTLKAISSHPDFSKKFRKIVGSSPRAELWDLAIFLPYSGKLRQMEILSPVEFAVTADEPYFRYYLAADPLTFRRMVGAAHLSQHIERFLDKYGVANIELKHYRYEVIAGLQAAGVIEPSDIKGKDPHELINIAAVASRHIEISCGHGPAGEELQRWIRKIFAENPTGSTT
jgi:hypothetical protein